MIVYSTNPDFKNRTAGKAETQTLPPDKQNLHIAFERKHRGGKQVTLVKNFVGSAGDLEALAKTLKTRLGVGGAAKEGEIIIQGDVRNKLGELLRKLGYRIILLFLFSIFNFQFSIDPAQGQYYSWGGDAVNVKWRRLKTDDVNLVYPKNFEENARRVMWYLDTIRPHISYGFTHPTMRTPIVLHTQNMSGNGMVMWAPKRMELLAAPGASYSEPWLKQLTIHEYRHNVQFSNLRRSTNRVLTWIFGEQLAFLGNAQFSIYILEGDATMMETEMSAFGRGFQPSWTMHYRAVNDDRYKEELKPNGKPWRAKNRQAGKIGTKDYTPDYWFSGSFRDHIPDHYRSGYQMVRWSYNHAGRFIWDSVARYVARNPQFVVPMAIALKKQLGFGTMKLFRHTFADLNAHWDSLPRMEDSSQKIATPWRSYTTYTSPQWLTDTVLVAFKADLDRTNRIVKVNTRTGRERHLAYTGVVGSQPVLKDGVLWWTELRSSVLWPQKVNSRLVSYDLVKGRKRVRNVGQIFFPTPIGDGTLAAVSYDATGRFSIIKGGETLVEFPLGIELTGLAWDNVTDALYFIGLDDGGMWLGKVTDENYEQLTPSRHITISDLRASGGKLYFGSIVSGKDEAHCYDLATGTEYRLSTSAYGSFQPAPSADGARVALTTYDRNGYHLAVQDASQAIEQEQLTLPLNIVNPDWKRWDLPQMDSLVYTPAQEKQSKETIKTRKYHKAFKLFRPHSWLPIGFYPPGAIQEMDLTIDLGATVMSQNLLSDMTSWLSYGWGPRKGHLLRGGLSYSGLGPVIDFDFVVMKNYYSLAPSVSLPMILGSGYWFNYLMPQVNYLWAHSAGSNLDQMSYFLTYQGQSRMAQKEFLPRWGFTAQVGYAHNPRPKNDFREYYLVTLGAYLPGVVRPHSISLRLSWQETVGVGNRIFVGKGLSPRGTSYDRLQTRRWASASLDYQLPVWYPEGGIPGVLYFKRIRVNVFADYARWQGFGGKWQPLYSYGGDIILDISPFRTPDNTNFALRLTLAKPSDRRGVFFGFGFEAPI